MRKHLPTAATEVRLRPDGGRVAIEQPNGLWSVSGSDVSLGRDDVEGWTPLVFATNTTVEYAIRHKGTGYIYESPPSIRYDLDWHVRWMDLDKNLRADEEFEVVERDVSEWRVAKP